MSEPQEAGGQSKSSKSQYRLANALNTREIAAKALIDLNGDIPEPPVCLTFELNGDKSIFGTQGNFSVIIGKAKSRKTYFLSALVASCFMDVTFQGVIRGQLPDNKKRVLYFDTEQSRYHVLRVAKRIIKVSGLKDFEKLSVYSLRAFSIEQRIAVIDYCISSTPDVGLVVIDGIRDLTSDINASDQANSAVSLLMKWSEENNIHIITVLHQNKGDSNARGHLGTEVTNKAESVISLSKDPNNSKNSIVAPEYCRDKEFKPFGFTVNEHSLPVILADFIVVDEKHKKVLPVDLDPYTHIEMLQAIFKNQPFLTYGKFCSAIASYFAKSGVHVGTDRAKMFAAYYAQENYVTVKPKQKGNTTHYALADGYNETSIGDEDST